MTSKARTASKASKANKAGKTRKAAPGGVARKRRDRRFIVALDVEQVEVHVTAPDPVTAVRDAMQTVKVAGALGFGGPDTCAVHEVLDGPNLMMEVLSRQPGRRRR